MTTPTAAERLQRIHALALSMIELGPEHGFTPDAIVGYLKNAVFNARHESARDAALAVAS